MYKLHSLSVNNIQHTTYFIVKVIVKVTDSRRTVRTRFKIIQIRTISS